MWWLERSCIGQIRHQLIFLECVDCCAENVRNIAKNTGYGEVEFNEVDGPQLLGPCSYDQIVLATVINVYIAKKFSRSEKEKAIAAHRNFESLRRHAMSIIICNSCF